MPEIKNNFMQGKMNKDLDERLIPNGQYRDALNIEVSTAEDASVGTIKNILGNTRVDVTDSFPGIPQGFKCVGSIADEKTNSIYWFISSYEKDAIIEYSIEGDVTNPILVDLYAGTHKAVLKFSGNIITGINIIGNLLFWTDNTSDPKKINIEDCRRGTQTYAPNSGTPFSAHTQLLFENGSFDGITLKYVAEHKVSGPTLPVLPKYGAYFWFEKNQIEKLFDKDLSYDINANYFLNTTEKPKVRVYRNGKSLGTREVQLWGDTTGLGSHGRIWTGANANDWEVGDVLFGSDVSMDIEERHITVIKPKPLNAPSIKINHTQKVDGTSNIPNLFETKFPRFSYRYKYRDGEFSVFAPFTNAVFNPKYTKDTNNSSNVNVFYNKDTAYDIKDPHNKAMVNSIHSVELSDFITAQTPEDVIEIDILYKQEDSPVIYSIGTIKHIDPEWYDWSNHEGYDLGEGRADNGSRYQAVGGYTKG